MRVSDIRAIGSLTDACSPNESDAIELRWIVCWTSTAQGLPVIFTGGLGVCSESLQ